MANTGGAAPINQSRPGRLSTPPGRIRSRATLQQSMLVRVNAPASIRRVNALTSEVANSLQPTPDQHGGPKSQFSRYKDIVGGSILIYLIKMRRTTTGSSVYEVTLNDFADDPNFIPPFNSSPSNVPDFDFGHALDSDSSSTLNYDLRPVFNFSPIFNKSRVWSKVSLTNAKKLLRQLSHGAVGFRAALRRNIVFPVFRHRLHQQGTDRNFDRTNRDKFAAERFGGSQFKKLTGGRYCRPNPHSGGINIAATDSRNLLRDSLTFRPGPGGRRRRRHRKRNIKAAGKALTSSQEMKGTRAGGFRPPSARRGRPENGAAAKTSWKTPAGRAAEGQRELSGARIDFTWLLCERDSLILKLLFSYLTRRPQIGSGPALRRASSAARPYLMPLSSF
ncbi:hypothetical protein EVAR_18767_1 [Eumeta japonica]|uniref:Uncharacterized protein n=1 Tax=Eumeta variegata TaxID=151549 RepID=A0A4C1UNM6_EUMVA|nr:hypothetical protein EVAR_18767_1 [Eumeta japonica]